MNAKGPEKNPAAIPNCRPFTLQVCAHPTSFLPRYPQPPTPLVAPLSLTIWKQKLVDTAVMVLPMSLRIRKFSTTHSSE
ncbi:hypothetical protein XELAEV_18002439mg [Xenopus laevis]|uniref:Uncharacterized protein n=1 Tax=Xenopus laevis TaxID=8355 RepID=A0A974GYT7_XENLA|nr:hypothetical protein XELAEV_18002439mg [Xenopus laevis]